MKVLVMSDSHGSTSVMRQAMAIESPDIVLHLGDNDRDCTNVMKDYPKIPFRCVRGNCDYSAGQPEMDDFTIEGKRFFMTHGHHYRVKTGYSTIINYASALEVDVLLFGHTHIPYYAVDGNLSVINPGSIGMGSKTYAVLTLESGAVVCEIKTLPA